MNTSDEQLHDESVEDLGLTIDRRKVLVTSAWAVPAIAVATAAPAFALSTDPIVISDNGSARTSDEAGSTPSTSGTYWNVKLKVAMPAGTFLTGLQATITCTGATTNGLQHKGATTSPGNVVGSRGAFVFSSGLYTNETSSMALSAPAPDAGGSVSEPAYVTWVYTIPDALLIAGTTVPLQFTFKGIGTGDVPITINFSNTTASAGGVLGTALVCASASSGAVA